MYFWRHNTFTAAVSIALLFWAQALLAVDVNMFESFVAKNIHYPEYDSAGALKFEIFGNEARFLADETIFIVNPKLNFYQDGWLLVEVSSPECQLDRKQQKVVSTATVEAVRSDLRLSGCGYAVDWKDNMVNLTVHSRVKLLHRNPQQDGSLEISSARLQYKQSAPEQWHAVFSGGVTITNQEADADGKLMHTVVSADQLTCTQTQPSQQNIVLTGNTKVVDAQGRVSADRLVVVLARAGGSGSAKVASIEAFGSVRIFNDAHSVWGEGEQVRYDLDEEKFVLGGQPSIQAGRDRFSADVITYWRNTRRIVCEPQAQLVVRSRLDEMGDLPDLRR